MKIFVPKTLYVLSPCGSERQIGARLRLREIHRAGPFTFDELRQVERLLFIAACGEERLDRAVGEQRTQCEGEIRRVQRFDARRRDELRQALPAEVHRMDDALPAAFRELTERGFEAGRRRDFAVRPRARRAVTGDIQRRQDFAAKTRGFLDDGLRRVEACIFVTRQRGDAVDIRQFLHYEQHVLDRGAVAHRLVSSL
jgi:hypothetical protein